MTDHRNAAEQAKTSALFKLMADRIPGVVWSTDTDLRLTSTWGAGLAALDLQPNQVVGKTLAEYFQTEDEEFPVIAAHRRALQGESVDFDFDWSGRIYRSHVERLVDEKNTILGCIGFAHDITEQKQAEAALRESEEHYRLLSEAIPQPIWRSDGNGNVIEFNRRWYEYTGQAPAEAKGNGWMKALHPDDVAGVAQRVQAAVASGGTVQVEYRLRRASDGSYRWHLARSIPMKDKDGRISARFGSATDIDDQKRVEVALRESQERFRAFMDNSPGVAWMKDEHGRHVYLSKSYERRFGVRLEDWRGKTDFELWPLEVAQQFRNNDMAVLTTGNGA